MSPSTNEYQHHNSNATATQKMAGAQTSSASVTLQPRNVNDWERIASLALGIMGIFLLARRLTLYLLLGVASLYFIYRGLSGYCYLYEKANLNTDKLSSRLEGDEENEATPSATEQWMERPHDSVEEASWESFPASDPPAF